ncbi:MULTISPECIES: hypothetical protein [Parachlamydia]|uniref:hypothetical protein n=1 Tax=Parachlamydia TaxID=83551 RepID=UPI0001C17BAA|nr:hypothetical protein [Parachlamydia acanthamoebae]EFB42153.1 hypothetical protein pah_c014o071 [Parachlamydia acanthamoebae str. Hall's coccus]
MAEQTQRLFFGFEIEAPWPQDLPKGRVLTESCRHMTLAFLGNVEGQKVHSLLPSFPKPSFQFGLLGYVDHLTFLPKKHPRVVAWHVECSQLVEAYQKDLIHWLQTHAFTFKERETFLPHITIARAPFSFQDWRKSFEPFPVVLKAIHLYESLGNLNYVSRWSYSLIPPFEEFEHTADVAFCIRGTTLADLCIHAQAALSFLFPPIRTFFPPMNGISSVEEIIQHLNAGITRADGRLGCPFKAVSLHGDIRESKNHFLEWEMIVDV